MLQIWPSTIGFLLSEAPFFRKLLSMFTRILRQNYVLKRLENPFSLENLFIGTFGKQVSRNLVLANLFFVSIILHYSFGSCCSFWFWGAQMSWTLSLQTRLLREIFAERKKLRGSQSAKPLECLYFTRCPKGVVALLSFYPCWLCASSSSLSSWISHNYLPFRNVETLKLSLSRLAPFVIGTSSVLWPHVRGS